MLPLVVMVAVLAVVGERAGAEPCFTCSHDGGNRFATASSLATAGSYASSNGGSHTSSHANSRANSYANSYANSHASSHASSSSYSRSQGGGYSFGHPTSCPGCGCGGCGGSCGWCGGNFGRRKRRSIENLVEKPELMETYNRIAAEDKDECGLRLVCELAQKDPRDLADDEIQILLPYRGAGKSDGTVYGNYDEAAWHGQEGHKCPTFYSLCAFSADKILTDLRNLELGVLEQPE